MARWTARYRDELFGFIKRRVKCSQTAADLTQETLLRLHVLTHEQPVAHTEALAFTIARNLTIDHQRQRQIRERYADRQTDPEQLAGLQPSPEQQVIDGERLVQLQAALHELPVDCRNAFLLHGLEGLSYVQIGERLGISKSMVAKHLARAILHCRTRLKQ